MIEFLKRSRTKIVLLLFYISYPWQGHLNLAMQEARAQQHAPRIMVGMRQLHPTEPIERSPNPHWQPHGCIAPPALKVGPPVPLPVS